MAFFRMEPFGSHYDDLRAGMVAAMIANVHRNPKVRQEPFSPLDLAPWNDLHREHADPEPIYLEDKEELSLLIETMMFPRRE
ncbi:phage tail assembly protein T [Cupriavidus malaysiensis]|uniref:Minor tail T domain-containing protein n=1 Tax=Cupriavidus malaysiensis TaxID=367825 RepID=A0ABM6F5J7_9BURK|nr:hypothetical protein [Cupriavidus malaysiensis]AOZ06766.1 hypothetical protein BKK80_13770 [Cupriavidus malaysiensis]